MMPVNLRHESELSVSYLLITLVSGIIDFLSRSEIRDKQSLKAETDATNDTRLEVNYTWNVAKGSMH